MGKGYAGMKAQTKQTAQKNGQTIADLKPDPANARLHNPRNIGMLVDALHQVGAARSIVIDETDTVLAGNGVIEAAAEAGITKLQVVEADGETVVAVRRRGLTDQQKRSLALFDNRVAELAEWNPDVLRDMQEQGTDLSAYFREDELLELLDKVQCAESGTSDPDTIPEERPTDIRLGDMFQMGAHRLLCGDSTKDADVVRVMGGARAGLMNTDPPYGIAFDNAALGPTRKKRALIANDQLKDSGLQSFLESAFRCAVSSALHDSAAWYLWHAHLTQGFFAAAAAAANVVLHRQIIWVKANLILGRGQYHWKHEPCFMGWIDGHQPPDYGLGAGERTQTTVWEIAGLSGPERDELGHPTPKPTAIFEIPIVKHLKHGEVCYEPFAGSGPQIIAAEKLQRSCCAIELLPSYCQVIIDRWEAFSGKRAVKIGNAADG